MPKYVVLADHPPEICPASNGRTRARAKEALGGEALGKAMAEFGLSFVLEPTHLDPSHQAVAVVEAANVESVVQFVNATGLSQWNTVQVYPTTPIRELMETVDDSPIVFD